MAQGIPSSRFARGLVRCPHCDAGYDQESMLRRQGQRYECVSCGKAFTVALELPSSNAEPKPVAQAKPASPPQPSFIEKESDAPSWPAANQPDRKQAGGDRDDSKGLDSTASGITADVSSAQSSQRLSVHASLDMIGRRIGPIELTAALGAGSAGNVYLGHHHETNRDVTVKILPPKDAADATLRKRFEVTSALWKRLDHPNIIKVLDSGVRDELSYILLEYVDGADVAHLLKGGKRFPARRAMEIALQVLRGLDLAHQHGIVHGGVKPQNILVRRDGVAKLGDFGLARARSRAKKSVTARRSRESMHESDVGGLTLLAMRENPFAAPEVHAGEEGNARSDLYALGVSLLVMLTGSIPARFVEDLVEHGHVGLGAKFSDAFPQELDAVLRKLCALLPSERYATGEEAASAISRLLDSHCSANGACPQLPELLCEQSGIKLRERDILQETAAHQTTTMMDFPELLEKTGAGFDRGNSMRKAGVLGSKLLQRSLTALVTLVIVGLAIWQFMDLEESPAGPSPPRDDNGLAANSGAPEGNRGSNGNGVAGVDADENGSDPKPEAGVISDLDLLFDLCLHGVRGELDKAQEVRAKLRKRSLSSNHAQMLRGIELELAALKIELGVGERVQAELHLAQAMREIELWSQADASLREAEGAIQSISADSAALRLIYQDALGNERARIDHARRLEQERLSAQLRADMDAGELASAAISLHALSTLAQDGDDRDALESMRAELQQKTRAALSESVEALLARPEKSEESPEEKNEADTSSDPESAEKDNAEGTSESGSSDNAGSNATPRDQAGDAAPESNANESADEASDSAADTADAQANALDSEVQDEPADEQRSNEAFTLQGVAARAELMKLAGLPLHVLRSAESTVEDDVVAPLRAAKREELACLAESIAVLVPFRAHQLERSRRMAARLEGEFPQQVEDCLQALLKAFQALSNAEAAWQSNDLERVEIDVRSLREALISGFALNDAAADWMLLPLRSRLMEAQALREVLEHALQTNQQARGELALRAMRRLGLPVSEAEERVAKLSQRLFSVREAWSSRRWMLVLLLHRMSHAGGLSQERQEMLVGGDWSILPRRDAGLLPSRSPNLPDELQRAQRSTRAWVVAGSGEAEPKLHVEYPIPALEDERVSHPQRSAPLVALPSANALMPDGQHVLLRFNDGRLACWRTRPELSEFASADLEANPASLALGKLGELVSVGGADGYLRVLRVPALREELGIPFGQSVVLSALGPQGTWVAGAGDDGTLGVYRQSDGQLLRSRQFAAGVRAMSAAPDGSMIALISGDTLHVLDAASLESVATRTSRDSQFAALAWSPFGGALALSDDQGNAALLDCALNTLQALLLPGRSSKLTKLRWVMDGRALAGYDGDPAAMVWVP